MKNWYQLYSQAIEQENLESLKDLGWQIITNSELEQDELFWLSNKLIKRFNEIK
jgi:hypothetical protein